MATQDVTNLHPSSSHRMPTVSASQALRQLDPGTGPPAVSTGLSQLDAFLCPSYGRRQQQGAQQSAGGGLRRGHVSEVYGPPGVGKTALAMQTAAKALRAGQRVIWIDCSFPVPGPRFRDILLAAENVDGQASPKLSPTATDLEGLLSNFDHFVVPSLAHLIALLRHYSSNPPALSTSVMVIESISTLFNVAFPRTLDVQRQSSDVRQTPNNKKQDAVQWAAGRRWSVMGDLVAQLGKLAVMRQMAVLLTTQTVTRVSFEAGAMLVPALQSNAWDNGIMNRIVLFRDWPPAQTIPAVEERQRIAKVRFAGVSKANGVTVQNQGLGHIVPFIIRLDGIHDVALEAQSTNNIGSLPILPGPGKRKRDEIPDSNSEDEGDGSEEDFSWLEDDLLDGKITADALPDTDTTAESKKESADR